MKRSSPRTTLRASPRARVAANILIVAVLSCIYLVVDRAQDSPQDASKRAPAPPFRIPLVTGGVSDAEVALEDFRGQPVLVNFWASWCSACKEERYHLIDLFREGVVPMLGIATSDKFEDAMAMETEHPHGYPVAFDPDGDVARRYSVATLPFTFLIDAEGRIVRRWPRALAVGDMEEVRRMALVGATPQGPAALAPTTPAETTTK